MKFEQTIIAILETYSEEDFPRTEKIDWDRLIIRDPIDWGDNWKLVAGYKGGMDLGYIIWDKETGEVENIFVGKFVRRQGLGTYLWEQATEYSNKIGCAPPEHSPRRTRSGDLFAKSIGGRIPSLTDDIDGWLNDA